MPVATSFLNEHHLALVANHESKGVLLTIWDRDSMTLLAEEKLGRSDQDDGLMTTNDSSQLHPGFTRDHQEEFLIRTIPTILGHRLVIASGNMAVVYSIHYPAKSSLLQLIGKAMKGKEPYLETVSWYASDMNTSEVKLMKKLRNCSNNLDAFVSIYARFLNDSKNHSTNQETIDHSQSEVTAGTATHERPKNPRVSVSIHHNRDHRRRVTYEEQDSHLFSLTFLSRVGLSV
jgi:hypothetical protein